MLRNDVLGWERHSHVAVDSPLGPEEVMDLESKRLRMVKRAFFANLAAGGRIYVVKSVERTLSEAEVVRLHEILNTFGPAVLMWAVAEPERAGQVEVRELRPRLFRAGLERFAPFLNADLNLPDRWIAACVCVWRLLHGTEHAGADAPAAAHPEPSLPAPARLLPPPSEGAWHERPVLHVAIAETGPGDALTAFPALYHLARTTPLAVTFGREEEGLAGLWAGPPVALSPGGAPDLLLSGAYLAHEDLHMIQAWFRNLGLAVPQTLPRIPLAGDLPEGREAYDVILSPCAGSGPIDAALRSWPRSDWGRVIDALLAFGLSVALCGWPGGDGLGGAEAEGRPVRLPDGLPPAEIVGYLRRARCVMTVDNGIGHLAHLLGLWGRDPCHVANRNPNALRLRGAFRPEGGRGHALRPERVLAAIFEVLGGFDPEACVDAHEDLTAANVPGWDHWVDCGREEGRNPGYTPARLHYGSLWREAS